MRHLILIALLLIGCPQNGAPDASKSLPDMGGDGASNLSGGGPDISRPSPDVEVFPDVEDAAVPNGSRFNEVMFAATHNSYSGEGRGSILAQLEIGVRFIEFDVHNDDFATYGFRVGHDDPGHELALGDENPATDAFTDWLAVVQAWRDANPNHLPLTLGVDLKDDLFGAATVGRGNLASLNQLIVETFGDALFTEADVGPGWPNVDAMRGRVLVVLSGNTKSRLGYRRVEGANPSVAAGDAVLIAHEAGGDVVLWWGPQSFTGYERFADAADPAVDLEGTDVVLVVRTAAGPRVRMGMMGSDHSVAWDGAFTEFGAPNATNPAVRFIDATTIRIVADEGTWEGSWNTSSRSVTWAPAAAATRPNEAMDGGMSVMAPTTAPYGRVIHIVDGEGTRRVRLEQHMFSESQIGGPAEFEADGVMIYAADAFGLQDVVWAEEKRAAGHVVRLWKFNLPNVSPDPPPTFPATDRPVSDWYQEYCDRCLRD